MKKLVLSAFILTPFPALAHVGADNGHHHAVAGFSHPLSGMDHCLAMVAVGLLAAFLGGKARGVLPVSFLAAMLAGFLLGAAKLFALPAYEAMILASVVGLGLALVAARRLPLLIGMAIAGLFGLAHGFAHGIEGTLTASYAAGFLAATAGLHGVGLGLGAVFARLDRSFAYRLAGGAIAAAGVALAFA